VVNIKVLVVDDDDGVRRTLADLLTVEGYTTETAADGYEALEKTAWLHPDIILLDMAMPRLDGWSVVGEVRARGEASRIIVMTIARVASVAAKSIEADGYVPKPIVPDMLLHELRRLSA
jgi:two-component system, OmpR family, response regulator MprA